MTISDPSRVGEGVTPSPDALAAARTRYEGLLGRVVRTFATSCGVTPRKERAVLLADCRSGGMLEALYGLAPEASRIIAVDARRGHVDRARERVRESGDTRTFVSMHGAGALPFAAEIFSLLVDVRPHADRVETAHVVRSFRRLALPDARLLLLSPVMESAAMLHALVEEFVRSPGGRDLRPALESWRAAQLDEEGGLQVLREGGWRVVDSATLGFRHEGTDPAALHVLQQEVLGPILPRIFTASLDRSAAAGWVRLALARYFEGRVLEEEVLWNAYFAVREEGELA